jgi:hypothetical protein
LIKSSKKKQLSYNDNKTHNVKLNFSTTNNGTTTNYWMEAIKQRSSALPEIYNYILKAAGIKKQLDSEMNGGPDNNCADIENEIEDEEDTDGD